MAGSYPDAPSRRMAWDVDGTVHLERRVVIPGSTSVDQWAERSAANRQDLNDEDPNSGYDLNPGAGTSTVFHILWIFPELREFDGWFFNAAGGVQTPLTSDVETSPDTTNGIDGTWTTRIAGYTLGGEDLDSYRSVTSQAVGSIRAVRYAYQANDNQSRRNIRRAHIYGEISPGETEDRLLFIDEATGVEYTAPIDFGDIPRGSSEDFQFRLKNNSTTLTINNIQYTAESIFESSGDWYTFTLPAGNTYQATRQIASLGAGVTTGIITGRRITPAGEALQVHAGRIVASHDSLS